MSLEIIDSLADPRLAPYRELKKSNLTRWSGRFIAEGEKVVRRLLASDYSTESVLAGARLVDAIRPAVPEEVSLLAVPDEWLPELVGFNFHRGLLACGLRKPPLSLAALMACLESAARLTLVVCPDVQDPGNLGGILRVASALGADAVLLGPACADPFSRRVLRVSMGTALTLPIVPTADLATDLARLASEWNFERIATVLDERAERLENAPRKPRLAILFGSEGHGLSEVWIDSCERSITVPMQRGTDSLNVAVAAAVFLHHFQRVAATSLG